MTEGCCDMCETPSKHLRCYRGKYLCWDCYTNLKGDDSEDYPEDDWREDR